MKWKTWALAAGSLLGAMAGSGTAHAWLQDEITPASRDVLYQVRQISGRESTLVNTEIDGLVSRYGRGFSGGDHVQGITMTASGRIVVSMSRSNDPSTTCNGLLAYSSPFDPHNPDLDLNWQIYCPSADDSPENHPSSIQAVGEVIIVGTHQGSRFYRIDRSGRMARIRDLNMQWVPNPSDSRGARDSSGIAFNPVDERYYAINAGGPVGVGSTRAQLCRTAARADLSGTALFYDCTTFDTVISSQGANLMFNDDGTLYLVNAFPSDEMWPDDQNISQEEKAAWYESRCVADGAQALVRGWDVETPYTDIISVSQIDYSRWFATSAQVVYQENVGRTQQIQTCVQNRPSFRFAGGVSTLTDGTMVALWAGRQNPPVALQTDGFEFSFQILEPEGARSVHHSVAIDCATDGIDNEGTGSTITATFFDRNWNQLGRAARDDISNGACFISNPTLEATLNGEAEYVKISTDGSDAFMIDRILMYRQGVEVSVFGANNDRGWCLSTDEDDGRGSWEYAAGGICTSEHTWSYSNLPVENPRDAIIAQNGIRTTQRYSVSIDCSTENITNDWTSGTITATFYDSNWQQIGRASRNDLHERNCTWTTPELEATTNGDAEYVKISTDSGDAFMIDRVILNRNGDEVATFGANNDKGWCLSTEASDGQGAWQYSADGVCTSEHTWSYSNLPVDNPRDRILTQRGNTTTHRYSLDIDCDVDGIDNEGTGSRLTAVYLDSNRREIGRSSFQEDTNAPILPICRDMEWDTIVTGTPRYLQIHTAGSDGAMLDQIFVERDGVEVKVLGASNDSGWCLSTQESDAHGSWQGHAFQNTCRTYWEFDL